MRSRQASIVGQLAAYDSLGYVRWQNGSAGRWLVTPVGGTEMNLSTREVELFLSGLSTGAQGRRVPSEDQRRERQGRERVNDERLRHDPVIFEQVLDDVEQLLAEFEAGGVNRFESAVEAERRLRTLREVLRDHPMPLAFTERTVELSKRSRQALAFEDKSMTAEEFAEKLRDIEQVFAQYREPQTGQAMAPILEAAVKLKGLRQELMRHQDLFPVNDPVRQRVIAAVNVSRWLLGIPQ